MLSVSQETKDRFSRQGAALCTCWRIVRLDGKIIALTDHDRDLSFSGTLFKSSSGADGSALESTTSLVADNADIVGAFSLEEIESSDVQAGLYDGASIEVFRVDWEKPEHRTLVKIGVLGEIDLDGETYRAEFRSLKHQLNATAGRVYSRRCDAELGDLRCGVNLTPSNFTVSGVILEATERTLRVAITEPLESGWLAHGTVAILEGALAGLSRSIFEHNQFGNVAQIELWQAVIGLLEPETPVILSVGCDKSISTCSQKFNNHINFRGFPEIPGTDSLVSYPIPTHEAQSR